MSRWRPAPRNEMARAAIDAAEADRRARPERYRLDPDDLAAAAVKHPGDEDRFEAGWREGLEQYLGSAREDGRLNAFGLGMASMTAISRLRAGATMSRFIEADPGRVASAPDRPIFITGGWRTGTTFLFRLLATDPRLRAPLPIELGSPCRLAGTTDDEREALIEASVARSEMLYAINPELRAIHDSGARLAEECGLAMGADLRNWGFSSTTRLNSYSQWLAGQDLGPSYLSYRHVLQVLDRHDGRRWVLKAPPHTAELPNLVAAFPGAVVVQLHRDIVETVASGASLFAVFRSMYSDEVDAADVGRFQADQTELWFRRAAEFRADPASNAATFVDLDYRTLVSDPVAAITQVYAAADLDPPTDPAAFVAAYHDSHPRHAHGTHRYTAADFGLDEHELRERFAFLTSTP